MDFRWNLDITGPPSKWKLTFLYLYITKLCCCIYDEIFQTRKSRIWPLRGTVSFKKNGISLLHHPSHECLSFLKRCYECLVHTFVLLKYVIFLFPTTQFLRLSSITQFPGSFKFYDFKICQFLRFLSLHDCRICTSFNTCGYDFRNLLVIKFEYLNSWFS